MDERHLRAERRPRLGQLDTDDAAAEDREPRRHLRRGRRLDVRPRAGIAQARRCRGSARPSRWRRPRPCGRRAPRRLAPRRHAALAVQAPAASHERDAVLLEPRQLARVVEVRDHLVAPREHGRHVDRPDSRPGDALDLTLELDRTQQCLRRHAGVVRALAADEPVLDDRDRDARSGPACPPPPRRRRRHPSPPRRTRARCLPRLPGRQAQPGVIRPEPNAARSPGRPAGASSASAGRSARP